MAKELIINASLPEIRIALMEDGRIQELLIERESDKGIVGNIYKGRVTRVLPGMQAAFVDVGLDKAAFLYVDDIYVHPKVMGDETEVDSSEDEVDGGEEVDAHEAHSHHGHTHGHSHNEDELHEGIEDEYAAERAAARAYLNSHAEESSEGVRDEENLHADAESHLAETDEGVHASESSPEELSDDESLDADGGAEAFDMSSEDSDSNEGDEDSEDDSEEDGEDDSEGEELSADAVEPALDENGNPIPVEAGAEGAAQEGGLEGLNQAGARRRGRNRNRRRGRGRNKTGEPRAQFAGGETGNTEENLPENFNESVNESGQVSSDRAQMEGESATSAQAGRGKKPRAEFKEPRTRDRRIKTKHTRPRAQASIADLLKEGQEVIVQIAKDPIATKGARLTCHVSLPGRHLVCMPSVDHVGVSRRIERDDERRRLRDFVERNRPRKMGFIVRTASGGKDPESWIKQDIDYLSKLWTGIRAKADEVSAPSLVYEDLNSILRAIRDWVNEDIDKIIVDSRYHYNDLQAFADRFMPALHEKLELYHGDVPIFDAYGISSELHRSLERKVWLKSGGYLVIDQAEALVAIDVNTGRYVGKKSLEDTILKTNIEAAEEIAHQLRLRNCGGIIICDFIDMERDDNRMRVYRALDEALKKDRARPTIQKISELGLVEMTRKRTRDTVIRTLCEPCTQCEGKGFVKSTMTVAYEILREIERLSVDREAKKILVSAHETVINVLAIELRDALDQLERRYNKSVYLQAVMDYHSEQFEVVTDRAPSKKATQDIARQLRVERERSERKEKNRSRRDNGRDNNRGDDRNDRNNNEGRDGEGRIEARDDNRNEGGRNEGNRNEGRKSNRNERKDRGNRNERNDRNEQNSSDAQNEGVDASADSQSETPAAPVARPAGAFVTARANKPKERKQKDQNQTAGNPEAEVQAGEAPGASDEDAQPSFDEGGNVIGRGNRSRKGGQIQSNSQQASQGYEDQDVGGGDHEEGNDEDQLAYLRAQAAQDAAIAGLANPNANGNRQNRGGQNQAGGRNNNRNQNGRNQNNRGGRNQNNRGGGQGGGQGGSQGQGGGQRFKPHHRGGGQPSARNQDNIGNSVPVAAPAPTYAEPQQASVPDYEVISRNDGSES